MSSIFDHNINWSRDYCKRQLLRVSCALERETYEERPEWLISDKPYSYCMDETQTYKSIMNRRLSDSVLKLVTVYLTGFQAKKMEINAPDKFKHYYKD